METDYLLLLAVWTSREMAHHRAFTYFIALHPGELYNSGEAAAKRKTNEFCWLLKPHGTELALRPLPLPSSPLKNSDFFQMASRTLTTRETVFLLLTGREGVSVHRQTEGLSATGAGCGIIAAAAAAV